MSVDLGALANEIKNSTTTGVDVPDTNGRYAVVQSNQSSSITVRMSDSTVDISGVKCIGGLYPAGQTVFVLKIGSDLIAFGSFDTGWQTPTFQNSWVSYGNPYDAKYRRIGDLVEMKGLVRSGTAGSVIFVLPSGYRVPFPDERIFVVSSNSAYGEIRINNNGDVSAPTGSTAWFSLDPIRFRMT